MQFYRKAESAATRILEAFQKGNLPKALAPMFIRRRDNVPCRQWSWSNQLLVALAGHSDARGYRQWQEVGRHVKKGEKSFPILAPVVRKRTEKDPETGEEEQRTWIAGFTSVAVFGVFADRRRRAAGRGSRGNVLAGVPAVARRGRIVGAGR